MPFAFDPAKSQRNAELRGMPFEMAEHFDFATAIIVQDKRQAYPEPRYQALGMIGRALCFLVFTPDAQAGARIISLRRASRKERRRWQQSRTRT